MTLRDVPQRCGYDHYIGTCPACSGTYRNPTSPEPKAPTLEEMRETAERIRAMDPCLSVHVMGLGRCMNCGKTSMEIDMANRFPSA